MTGTILISQMTKIGYNLQNAFMTYSFSLFAFGTDNKNIGGVLLVYDYLDKFCGCMFSASLWSQMLQCLPLFLSPLSSSASLGLKGRTRSAFYSLFFNDLV